MAALHHVSTVPDDAETLSVMIAALGDGDIVVLLDQAALALQQGRDAVVGLPQRRRGVRWVLPALERVDASGELPSGIEIVDAAQWLALIVDHPVLVEWS